MKAKGIITKLSDVKLGTNLSETHIYHFGKCSSCGEDQEVRVYPFGLSNCQYCKDCMELASLNNRRGIEGHGAIDKAYAIELGVWREMGVFEK